MAEPARQKHPEVEPEIRPRLGVIQGGGESTPERGNLGAVNPAPGLKEQEESGGLNVIQGGGESTDDRADLRAVAADQEDNPGQIPITGSGNWAKKQSFRAKFFGSAKKNSAVTAIIGLLLTGAFGLSLLSPSLLLMQLRETLLDKFNDQLAVLDIRQTAILKKKLAKTTLDGCKITSIRCKYKSLGDRHVERLKKAGIDIEGDKTTLTGRTKPTAFVYNGESIAASDLLDRARSDPGLRSAMRHGYNPKFAAFSDAIANKVLSNLGVKKSKSIKPSSDKEKMKDDLKATASGEAAAGDGTPRKEVTKDADGNDVTEYYDADGNKIDEKQFNTINSAIEEIENRAKLAGELKSTAIKAGLKGALTSTAFGLGALDSMCTGWVAMRVATFAAKIYGQRQLIRYSYEFLKAPDNLMANAVEPPENQIGPEEIEFLSTILTTPNAEGQTATDSDGYKYAAYGDLFNPADFDTSIDENGMTDAAVEANMIQNETSRYVNGQILPDNAVAKMLSFIQGASNSSKADSICETVKSWKGQAVIWTAAVLGTVAAFFTGGVSVGLGAAAQIGVMATVSVAFALLMPKLADMAKGELITGDENGNQAGNAIVSGMGGFNAQASQGRALPVLEKQDAVEYNQVTETVAADYNEVDRYERGPLDPTSKNTFIGSIVNSLLPYTSKMSRGGSVITSTSSLVSQSFGNIFSPKSNAAETKASEFEVCNDFEYEGLAADPFCNLRYGMSKKALQIDPETVLNYMEDGEYIEKDSEDGAPGGANGSKYQEYIDQCIERETSIGDTITDSDEGSGQNCIQGRSGENEERNTMFRLFYIDTSVQDGMDSDFSMGAEETTAEDEKFTAGTYNLLNADGHTPESIEIAGPDCNRADDPTCAKARALTQSKVILGESGKYPQMDIVGLQETAPSQYRQLLKNLPTYEGVPSDDKNIERMTQQQNGAVGIVWNTDKFTKVEEGYVDALSNVANTENRGKITSPWVGLESAGGRKVYVISAHYPVAAFSDPELGDKGTLEKAMKLTLDWANEKAKLGTVLILGDFNDHTNEKTTYCGFTESGLFQNTHDMAKGDNASTPCPNPTPDFGIDHIYASTGSSLTAKDWTHMPRLKEASAELKADNPLIYRASDHSPVSVDLTFPGSGTDLGTLNFGSYNILTSTRAVVDGDAGYDEKDDARMKAAADLITKEQLHVVATQEVRGAERNGLLSHLPDHYSGTKLDGSGHDFSEVVFWDNRIFSEEAMGTFTIPKDGNTLRDAMWVKLKLKGGQGGELFVFNIHASLDESQRVTGANHTLAAIRQVVGDSGTPYIVAGDMNSNDLDPGRNAVYEVFKASGMLKYARDATENRKGYNCDTQNGFDGRQDCRRGKGSHIDQIWVSGNPNIKVNRWENIANGETVKISDHNPVITNLIVPGLGSEEGTTNIPQPSKDGWVWPVPAIKDLGTLGWGESGSGGLHKGIDIGNRDNAIGSPVVAAHDGVITKSYGTGDSCGYYVVIKATGTPYWMGYQHLRDESAATAPVGKTVKAGDVIGRIGRQGGSTCGTAGFFHLHFSVETKNTISAYSDPGTNGTINPLTVLPR